MPVSRIIFRIDFDASYSVLNAPGDLLRLLTHDKDYWGEISENAAQHQFAGKFASPSSDFTRQLTFTPTHAVMDLESVPGLELKGLTEHRELATLLKLMGAFVEAFKVDQVRRIGVRIFYLGSIGLGFEVARSTFLNLVDKDLSASIRKTMGDVTDVGLVFDGEAESKIQYHLRAGPFRSDEQEVRKYFAQVNHKLFAEHQDRDLLLDLDLFDKNVSLAKVSPARWCKQLVAVQSEMVQQLEARLRK